MAESAHRAGNICDFVFTSIFEAYGQPVAHLIAYGAADIDAAGFGQTLQTRGDRDTIAIDDVTIGDNVAEIDPDAKLYPAIEGHCRGVCRHFALDLDSALDGIDDAAKLDEKPIAHRAYDTAAVSVDADIDQISADPVERCQGTFFVRPH